MAGWTYVPTQIALENVVTTFSNSNVCTFSRHFSQCMHVFNWCTRFQEYRHQIRYYPSFGDNIDPKFARNAQYLLKTCIPPMHVFNL